MIAHGGLCAAAVAAAAADQNQVAASLSDFELPNAAVDAVVRVGCRRHRTSAVRT